MDDMTAPQKNDIYQSGMREIWSAIVAAGGNAKFTKRRVVIKFEVVFEQLTVTGRVAVVNVALDELSVPFVITEAGWDGIAGVAERGVRRSATSIHRRSNNPAQTADDSLDSLYEEPGAYAGTTRKSFGCSDDITLLIAVNDAKPCDLKDNRRFKVDKDGQGCKTRFNKLAKANKERSFSAMRRSGTDEEFNECEQLLGDILSQVNDFVEKKDA
ncbi:hypothetical protein H257_10707 [Aphanomyces astaci]|uniref:Uncharacterized protein n=1 Tax=Aphanomyces astaci TaxID=112090 RepID=W4G6M2_APHAT|nr:hypothetical protein H257_10707 [Aphanomyces astaci]ETV74558.1 hypothetical protein H257_10707 [Aphanomyces astaci]|eukprot:XP_009835645.1 hypothetical protein H257_10707 [Aphanomyces astaci]